MRLWQIVFFPGRPKGFTSGTFPSSAASERPWALVFRWWFFLWWELRRFQTDEEMKAAWDHRSDADKQRKR